MSNRSSSRWRRIVAVAAGALLGASALAGAPDAAAVTPGVATGNLVIGGELNANPWSFYGDNYTSLRADIANDANFGPAGTVKTANYSVAPTGIVGLITPANLASLDVFVGGVPNFAPGVPTFDPGEYTDAEVAALRAFNENGGGLVLAANSKFLADTTDWLGFPLRQQKAFYDPSCGVYIAPTGIDEFESPSRSTVNSGASAHPIAAGPFGSASTVRNFHTVDVFTSLPAGSQGLYTLTNANQRPGVAIVQPYATISTPNPPGDPTITETTPIVSGTITINTQVSSRQNIQTVTWFVDGGSTGLIGTGSADGIQINTTLLADGTHQVRARITPVTGAGAIYDTADYSIIVDNIAPAALPVGYSASGTRPCPGVGDSSEINNDITGTSAAVIPAGALSATNGPIVVVSDLDMLSNAYDQYADNNRTFARNVSRGS